jgi:hypothetical protein
MASCVSGQQVRLMSYISTLQPSPMQKRRKLSQAPPCRNNKNARVCVCVRTLARMCVCVGGGGGWGAAAAIRVDGQDQVAPPLPWLHYHQP